MAIVAAAAAGEVDVRRTMEPKIARVCVLTALASKFTNT